jgi:DNA-binding MarR family transcriptional regulator
MSALRFCSYITVNGVVRDGESFVMEIASDVNANRSSLQMLVMSGQVVRALAEHMHLSSTTIAQAIDKLSQQFGWRRITVVADAEDKYYLRIAEQFYKTASLSTDSRFLQLISSSDVEDLVEKVDRLNLRILVLSLRPHLVTKLLCRAHERQLVWPEYAWIVHSVEVSEGTCGGNFTLDGVITIKLKNARHTSWVHQDCPTDKRKTLPSVNLQFLNSCFISSGLPPTVVVQQVGKLKEHATGIVKSHPYPSDLPPQYTLTVYIAIFYTATTACFILCTITLVLFICFRNDPAIKATSVSLSILIFIGCYLIILYLYMLSSNILPSLYKQKIELRNCLCTFFTIFHGVGLPMALILSTLLVKLLRVYWLFRLKRRASRASKITISNIALALYVFLISSPNALVSLVWSTFDPLISVVSNSTINGYLHITARCVSSYSVYWTLLLLAHVILISILLVTFAFFTRKITYQDFKDTKKIIILCFSLVFTCTTTLFYWNLLSTIRAGTILVYAVLHIGHYSIILECLGFIFAPKLFPIAKRKIVSSFQGFTRPY